MAELKLESVAELTLDLAADLTLECPAELKLESAAELRRNPHNGVIALDCLRAGMSQREIAALLYGVRTVSEEWGVDGSSLRASLRYVTRKAEGLRDGGYLIELLGARLGGDSGMGVGLARSSAPVMLACGAVERAAG